MLTATVEASFDRSGARHACEHEDFDAALGVPDILVVAARAFMIVAVAVAIGVRLRLFQ